MTQRIIKKTVSPQATPGTVWEILTQPEFTKQYMAGCEAVSEWRRGSHLTWKDENGAARMKGAILEIEPGRTLVFTYCTAPHGAIDTPKEYTTVSYSLRSAKDGHTNVSITHGDFTDMKNGPELHEEAERMWDAALAKIKELAEKRSAAKGSLADRGGHGGGHSLVERAR